jgi:predicted RecA/RadA family phage recombinase
MNNFVQDGDVIDFTAAEDLSSGELVQIGNRVGAALKAIANTETGSVRIKGVINAAKTASQAWAVGDKLYLNTSTKALTNVATAAYPYAGIAVEALGAGAGIVEGKCLLESAGKQAAVQAASVAADTAAMVVDFNALLVKLKAAGLMSNS